MPDTDRDRELARLFRKGLSHTGRIAEGRASWDVLGLLRSLDVPVPGDADWQQTGG